MATKPKQVLPVTKLTASIKRLNINYSVTGDFELDIDYDADDSVSDYNVYNLKGVNNPTVNFFGSFESNVWLSLVKLTDEQFDIAVSALNAIRKTKTVKLKS